MRRFIGFRRWTNLPLRYRVVGIAILAIFLLSSVLTSGMVAAHAVNPRSTLHIHHNVAPNDTTGTLLWRYKTGAGIQSQATLVNGIVYIGSNDGFLYALNASTGALVWSYQTIIVNEIASIYDSKPVVSNGIVYVDSSDGYMYALNASTGALVWHTQISNSCDGCSASPAIANGTVYIGSNDGSLYALDASTGVILWHDPIGIQLGGGNIGFAPVVMNGIVYIGSAGNGKVYALMANTGSSVWQYNSNCSFSDCPLAVVNGVVYVNAYSSTLALNASTGTFLWQRTFAVLHSAPVVVNGIVYTAEYGGIYALSSGNGTTLWSYQANNDFYSAPTISNGVVYIGGWSDRSVYALNANDGTKLWSYQTGGGIYDSPPAVGNGAIYFGSEDDYIYAISAPPPAGPQGSERLGGSNPSELGECVRCAGDPIDTFSGNFSHTWTDFSIPGRGIPLLFSRTYNAQAATQQGPLGSGWTDSYNFALSTNGSGNVTIQQEDGSTVTFAPNGSNGYTAPPRVLATLVQNSDGTFTFTRTNQLQYIFSASGQLVQEIDRNGYVTHLTYNASNQLTTVTDPAGRALTFTYGTNGLIAQITDPINRSVSFQYDTNGNLVAATDVNGGVTHFTYDANHLLLTMTDPRGGVTTNVYDSSARVISQTDPLNRTTTFSYGASSTTVTDPNSNVTVEQYQAGLLVSETKGYGTPQAAITSYTYDPLSLGVASITDPDGHIWTQVWDASGNLLSATDPLKRTTTYTYDLFNDLTSVTDPLGVTTTYTYDAHGNLLITTRPLSKKQTQTTTYTYGDTSHPGDVTAMTDPDGKIWQYSYDQYGNVANAIDPLTDKTTIQYNTIGWKTAQVSPNGNVSGGQPSAYTTSYTYDTFGDVLQVTDPLGHQTSYQYDANRNLIKLTNALGQITQYTYDADNAVTQVTRADGSTLTSGYDSDGNQIVQKDGLGHATTYAYDPLNRLIATTDPLQRKMSYSYNRAGDLTGLTNPAGQVTTYAYNAANEIIKISYSDGHTPTVSFTYNTDGERINMTDGTGKTTYSYDSLNRLIKSTNGAGSAVTYTYDLNNNLIQLTYPGGQRVNRSYNAAGRMTSVKDWLGNSTKFTYDADGNIIAETYPNKVKATLSYDQDDQVTSIVDKLGTSKILSLTYTRNNLSLLSSLKQPSSSRESYKYTPLNQLSAVNQQTFTYDKADNLIQNGTTTLAYDAANEVTSSTNNNLTTTYSYDAQGNRTQMTSPTSQVTTYTYDQANRLTAYGTTATYAYNGDGLRMSKTVSGTTEAFTWDIAEGLPQAVQDSTTQYVYGPGGLPLEQVSSNGAVLYYHQDQLGSTMLLTNAAGVSVATYTYGAYGNVTAQTGSVMNPFQYVGQYTDGESGLQYLRARYYDPNTGQFLTRDPLAARTQQPYGYAGENPINKTDVLGLFTAGLCLPVSLGFILGVVGEPCFQTANFSEWGFTETVGGGLQSPSIGITPDGGLSVNLAYSVGPAVQFSNGNHLSDLSGLFGYAGGSAGEGLVNGSVTGFAGKNSCGQIIYGAEIGYSVIPSSGVEVHAGASYTWVQSATNTQIAQWVFSAMKLVHTWH